MNEPNTQDSLKDFITDPKNIAKAVEGSMDKRNAVMTDTLDEQINHILANVAMPVVPEDHRRIRHAKQQLKTLFTEHSKEVDRLARIDELKNLIPDTIPFIPVGNVSDDAKELYDGIHDRIAQLKRNKGEDNASTKSL